MKHLADSIRSANKIKTEMKTMSEKKKLLINQFVLFMDVLKWFCMQEREINQVVQTFHSLTLSHIYVISTCSDTTAADNFWKYCGKRGKKCILDTISSFATTFST